MSRIVRIGAIEVGEGRPLALIAGPCVIEDEGLVRRVAVALKATADDLGLPLVLKASFDKANRTSKASFRGPGLDEGLRILAAVKRDLGLPVTTDVHEPWQAEQVGEVVDLVQVPAFLCRQTDLIAACGRTGKPVNVKKGQFVAPWDLRHAVDKALDAGAAGVIVTERGTSFGYNDLVVDLRSIGELAKLGVPVCFDATHSLQTPGGQGDRSGGRREHATALARAAVAAGADLVFAEVHEDPDRALSDAATQLPLGMVPSFARSLLRIAAAIDRPTEAG